MSSRYQKNPIFNQIIGEAERSGSDPLTLAATAIVESNLDPRAVGDNGTSFGLFQHHIGGAGGKTRESAQSFFDATKSIGERARAFKGGSGGEFAASVQRPADPAGYAQKVNRVIEELRGGVDLSELARPGVRGVEPRFESRGAENMRRLDAMRFFLQDEPELLEQIEEKKNEQHEHEALSSGEHGEAVQVPDYGDAGGLPSIEGGLGGYKDLIELGSQFGLRIQGDFQTTGGNHAPGSNHYSGKAIDFGDANNSQESLLGIMNFARQNPEMFAEAYFDNAGFYIRDGKVIEGQFGGHGDHVHLAVR